MMSGLTIVLGGGGIGDREFCFVKSAADAKVWLDVCRKFNVTHVDTAIFYSGSERILGEVGAGADFTIDTKNPGGFVPGNLTSENLIQGHKKSLEQLRLDGVDILYIHAPDDTVTLDSWLPGMDQLYRQGSFKRFGLSNFLPKQVRDVYEHCKQKGYVLPSVYEGSYSPVSRRPETELLPLLREYGMAFYVYGPLAGGFLTKTKQQVLDGVGRFDKSTWVGKMYCDIYARPSYLEALAEWEDIANETHVSRAELAYRWVSYNSPLSRDKGDAIIIGASSVQQLEQNLAGLAKGPLDKKTAGRIDEIWEKVKHEAALDLLDGLRADTNSK